MARRGARYKIDSSGSRCREAWSGRYALCDLCPRCLVRKKKRRK